MHRASHPLRWASFNIAGAQRRKRPNWLIGGNLQVADGQSTRESTTTTYTEVLSELVSVPCDYVTRNRRPLYARSHQSSPSLALRRLTEYSNDASSGFNGHANGEDFLIGLSKQEKEDVLASLLHSPGMVNVHVFARVLTSIPTYKEAGVARPAESWVYRLEGKLSNETTNHKDIIKPIIQCYAHVIQAWADSIGDDPLVTVKRAENWLHKAQHVATGASPSQVQQDLTKCYNAYLDACSKGRDSKSVRRSASRSHAQEAEATLAHMLNQYKMLGDASTVIPNTESFNFVLRAIAHCKTDEDVAERTSRLLKLMEDSVNNDSDPGLVVPPNPRSYCIWLNSLAAVARIKAGKSHHSRRRSDNDGLQEMKMLHDAVNHMLKLFERGRLGVFENNVPHNTLLGAWAGISGVLKGVGAPMEAEKVFRTMVHLSSNKNLPEVSPDTTSYLQVIRAWAKSGSDRAGEKTSWWLEKQWQDFEENGQREDLMPTTKTYIEAMLAWSNAGIPDEAEDLLMDLLRRYESEKSPQLNPNTEMFAACIRAWLQAADSTSVSQEEQVDRLNRAVEWLDYMISHENNGGPATTHDLYFAVLKSSKACAYERPDVLDTAYRIFSNLRDSRHHLQPGAYSWLLEVGLRALPKPENDEARRTFLTRLVKACCDDGLISRPLVLALVNGKLYPEGWTEHESIRMTRTLFPDWPIPASWTRNVKQTSLLPKPEDFKRKHFQKQRR